MNPDPDLFLILMSGLAALIGFPIARSIARRIDGRNAPPQPAALDAGVDARLARIEQAVESIAIEMERVSEGQRFTTKLLAERTGAPAGAGANGAGVNGAGVQGAGVAPASQPR